MTHAAQGDGGAGTRADLIRLYEQRFAEYGYDARTLGWRNTSDQELRFEVLTEIGDMAGRSVCDIGCGFGDLSAYLDRRFGGTDYTGIDIVPALVDEARRRYPQARFLCTDILEDASVPTADFVVMSGALSFRMEDNWDLAERMLRRMFEMCRVGVAANFLTSYVNFERPHNFHYSPESMFALCRTVTPWVTVRHDYPLWEFTVFLYKQPPYERAGETGGEGT